MTITSFNIKCSQKDLFIAIAYVLLLWEMTSLELMNVGP